MPRKGSVKQTYIRDEYVEHLFAYIIPINTTSLKIVHEPRFIWNSIDIVRKNGDVTVLPN